MAFSKRMVTVTVRLAPDSKTNQPTTFTESGTDTVTLPPLRTSVRIQNSGAPSGARASVQVWGMTPSLMNQLSTLGLAYNIVPKNVVTIAAGDEGAVPATVFSGTVIQAYASYDAMPDVPFFFECNSGVAEAVAPAAPSSFTGPTDVATIMTGLARQMNLGFENNGVNIKISNPYLPGNFKTQMQKIARDANINAEIINGNLLAIWPKGGNRTTTTVPIISKDTGMITAPAFTSQGIIVRTTFDPLISFGGLIKVRSTVLDAVTQAQKNQNSDFKTPADSLWAVNKLDLALDSQVPKGQWMSTIHAFNPNYPKPIPQQGSR